MTRPQNIEEADRMIRASAVASLGITDEQAKTVSQWVMHAMKHVQAGDDPMTALKKGQQEYSDFLREMADGLTPRARMARAALAAEVWAECNRRDAAEKALRTCQHIYEEG